MVIYKIIDPHNYLLMTLDGVKHAIIRTNQGNVQNLAELKQIMNTELKVDLAELKTYCNKIKTICFPLLQINKIIQCYCLQHFGK